MNILGLGAPELILILIIALVFAGPKRMVQWAYIAGRWLNRLRSMWAEMMTVVQKEFDDAGVDVKLPKDIPTRGNFTQIARDAMKPYTREMEEAMKDVKSVREEVTGASKEAKDAVYGSWGDTKQAVNGKPSAPSNNNGAQQTVNFGTWGGAAQPTTTEPAPPKDGEFGSWSRNAGQTKNDGDDPN